MPLRRRTRSALVALLVAVAVLLIGGLLDPARLFRALLLGWFFWLGLGLGCMALLMLQYLIDSRWGRALRPLLEAGTMTIPPLSLLAIPVFIGVHYIYPWSGGAGDEIAAGSFKSVWLSVPFFIARTVFYLAMLSLLAFALRSPRSPSRPSMFARSCAGLIIYFVTFSLAAVDWVMSLTPAWYSTIFPVQLIMGQAAFTVSGLILLLFFMRPAPSRDIDMFNDLGNLLLAFIMLWIYMGFMQFLIIWSGNLPEDGAWYIARSRSAWPVLAVAITLIHFAGPFLILLSRTAKRRPAVLAVLAGMVAAAHVADIFWIFVPSFGERSSPHWLDFTALVAFGAVAMLTGVSMLEQRTIFGREGAQP